MVREPNVSPHKQIIKDDDVKERNAFPLNKLKIKRFHFVPSQSCNIPFKFNSYHTQNGACILLAFKPHR